MSAMQENELPLSERVASTHQGPNETVTQSMHVSCFLFVVFLWTLVPLTAVAQNVNGQFEKKKEQLFHAVRTENVKAVRNMLEDKVPLSVRDDQGNTPLITASFMGHKPLVRLLIDKGADVNAQNDRGKTALMAAAVGSDPFT